MRTIGLIGGMSWESTAVYYRRMNERVRTRCGRLHSAPILLWSIDFQVLDGLLDDGRWDVAGEMVAEAATRLEEIGADCLLICSNMMHKVTPAVQARVRIPIINIIDETARVALAQGCRRPLLLGTRHVMELPFYIDRLSQRGLRCLIPEAEDRDRVHAVVMDELCRGWVLPSSRADLFAIIGRGKEAGADSVIFGSCEIGLLMHAIPTGMPTFDATLIHADAAVDYALALASAA